MAGSNAYAGPAAVLAVITTALATSSASGGQIPVDYAYDGQNADREYVYGGDIGGPHDPAAFRAGGGRRQRQERLSWKFYLRVQRPDMNSAECAQRALALGALIEEAVATASIEDGAGVSGLKQVGISRFDLQNYADDDARTCEITYTVDFLSMIA